VSLTLTRTPTSPSAEISPNRAERDQDPLRVAARILKADWVRFVSALSGARNDAIDVMVSEPHARSTTSN
jgi:hypothetical protein